MLVMAGRHFRSSSASGGSRTRITSLVIGCIIVVSLLTLVTTARNHLFEGILQHLPQLKPTARNVSNIKSYERPPPIHSCRIGNETVQIPTSAPRFIIIGAQKSGTSSLYEYLLDHPDAVPTVNWVQKKSTETHFFDFHYPGIQRKMFASDAEFYCHVRHVYANGQFLYDTLMADARLHHHNQSSGGGNLFSFEKTPVYITDAKRLPPLFKKVLPWLDKVVASLRNPTDRAYSHFNMGLRKGQKNSSADLFHEVVKNDARAMVNAGLLQYDGTHNLTLSGVHLSKNETEKERSAFDKVRKLCLARGLYEIQLRQWIDEFPLGSQLHVMNYDHLNAKKGGAAVRETYHELLRFLDLREYNVSADLFAPKNARAYSAPMHNKTRRILDALYLPYNQKLATILGDEWRCVWNSCR